MQSIDILRLWIETYFTMSRQSFRVASMFHAFFTGIYKGHFVVKFFVSIFKLHFKPSFIEKLSSDHFKKHF